MTTQLNGRPRAKREPARLSAGRPKLIIVPPPPPDESRAYLKAKIRQTRATHREELERHLAGLEGRLATLLDDLDVTVAALDVLSDDADLEDDGNAEPEVDMEFSLGWAVNRDQTRMGVCTDAEHEQEDEGGEDREFSLGWRSLIDQRCLDAGSDREEEHDLEPDDAA